MFSSFRFRTNESHSSNALAVVLLGSAWIASLVAAVPARAQGITSIRIDASHPYVEPVAAAYDGGTAKSRSGSVLGVNSRYLTLDGKPWLPVMGEFHFSRYPAAQWEEQILKMKAAGVNIVATYVIWIHHEEVKGQFDWNGQRDLRAFAELCAKHHMYVEPRIGPWAHAEARNGGLPDWVVKQGNIRRNDPVYLQAVQSFYAQIGLQLKGLLWKDGGPVVGVQLENEYSARGAGAGEEHILELKKMAMESGLDVPLYVVTGWDNAVIPARAVIPVYGGGYPDAPWDGSVNKLPPPEVYAFRFQSRVAANMGAMGGANAAATQPSQPGELPYFTAEIGGGIEDTYHRRPVIHADDIGAMFPVMLGSGVNLYGSYMFQGGENPEGKLTTLQESQATDYPNDLPIKSYDFQAPLGEFGDERTSFRKMKVFQYFLNDFGADLAPMMVHAPDVQPKSPADFSVARAAVRSKGDAGFLFVNNYVRGYPMVARPAIQFDVRLPGGSVQVPRHAVDIPAGAYFIWPFNLRAGGITIRYSTAQLFTRLQSADLTTLYFEAIPGIPVEFAFDPHTVRSLQKSSGELTREPGVTYVSTFQPGIDSAIDLVSAEGKRVRLVVLSAAEAEGAWKVHVQGADRLLISSQEFFANPDAQSGEIRLRSAGDPHFQFGVTPPLDTPLTANLRLTRTSAKDRAVSFEAVADTLHPELKYNQTQAVGLVPPIKLGPVAAWRANAVAQAPGEGELPEAGKWSIQVPSGAMKGVDEMFLEVRYQGDVARLYAEHRLLDDDFYNGNPWRIGLRRFLDGNGAGNFELSVLPLRKDAPVYFENPESPVYGENGQIGKIDGLRLVPVYQLVLDAKRP
jgi:hypothetical protein